MYRIANLAIYFNRTMHFALAKTIITKIRSLEATGANRAHTDPCGA